MFSSDHRPLNEELNIDGMWGLLALGGLMLDAVPCLRMSPRMQVGQQAMWTH